MINSEKFINQFAKTSQFVTWPVLFPLFNIFFDVNIKGREKLDNIKNPFIIISNHTHFYDSFLFRLVFPYKHLPIRFMAVQKFDWCYLNFMSAVGIIKFIYSLFGVFIVVPGRGIEKNLEKAVEVIEHGGNVLIYPEGKIILGTEIGPFKKGAAVLAQKTKVPVLPICMQFMPSGFFWKYLYITISDPIVVDIDISNEDLTQIFRNKILELYSGQQSLFHKVQ